MLTSSRARIMAVVVVVGVGVSLAAQRRTAQRPTMPAGEWWYYGGDSGSTKYSPLDQINRDTVKTLRVAWRWKTENFGASPEYNLEATPLMVKGMLYSTAGTRRDVVAIDAATGETQWMYRYDGGERGRVGPRQNHRGVAYWTDGNEARLLYVTPG